MVATAVVLMVISSLGDFRLSFSSSKSGDTLALWPILLANAELSLSLSEAKSSSQSLHFQDPKNGKIS